MSSAVVSAAAAVATCTHGVTTSRNVHRLQGRGPGQRRLSAPRRLPPPRSGLFGGLFGSGAGSSSSSSSSNTADEEQAFLEDEEGGKMVALDASSAGSLDGSSEEAFGPLASAWPRRRAPAACGPASGACAILDVCKPLKLVPLDPGNAPQAVLAVGFTQQEFERLRRVLHEDMDAGMVKASGTGPYCTTAGTGRTALLLDGP